MSIRLPLVAVAGIVSGLLVISGPLVARQAPAKADTIESLEPILSKLGVTLRVR
jgi:hypothetical protein